ncbi:hypothetical protein I3760_08G162600 [Carya illinoinensis]|nr:hypothetical protein I3760_08G162600 [Carya illinoinensis]
MKRCILSKAGIHFISLHCFSCVFIPYRSPINHPPHSASLKLTVEEEKFPSSFFFILITSVFLDSAAYIRGVNPEIELNRLHGVDPRSLENPKSRFSQINRGYHTATISNG